VTVIATGFGQQRRRKRKAAPEQTRDREREPALATAPAAEEGFDIPKEVLDVPSFLRDS
jgi:hypothetical protein